ncbi:MAG TPA: hypothetical protein VMW41_05660 [Candidatus Bathyarchaeia archaeon]|nr:hypothetical protein [Candidatus Bathyarchaeia archaeon]
MNRAQKKKNSSESLPPRGFNLPPSGSSVTTDISKIDDIEKKLVTLQEKIDEAKRTNIETIAIFVALFTFVSIEFQLTRSFNYLEFLYFSIFFGSLLIGFFFCLNT